MLVDGRQTLSIEAFLWLVEVVNVFHVNSLDYWRFVQRHGFPLRLQIEASLTVGQVLLLSCRIYSRAILHKELLGFQALAADAHLVIEGRLRVSHIA